VKKLLKHYFSGVSQQAIAELLGISQGTVSHWVGRFDEKATNNGLLNAAKEYGVLNEIEELRALSIELDKAGITTQEARTGVKIMKKFKKLGIEPSQHEMLVEVCAEVTDPGFIADALKLHQIKMESGLDYGEAIAQFEKTLQELSLAKGELEKVKVDLQDTTTKLEEQKKQLDSFQSTMDHFYQAAEKEFKRIKKELADKEKEAKVTQKEIKEVAALKADLSAQGLDIPLLIKLAKEFGHGKD